MMQELTTNHTNGLICRGMEPMPGLRPMADYLNAEPHFYCSKCKIYTPVSRLHPRDGVKPVCDCCLKKVEAD
jgi:hypothetical protein